MNSTRPDHPDSTDLRPESFATGARLLTSVGCHKLPVLAIGDNAIPTPGKLTAWSVWALLVGFLLVGSTTASEPQPDEEKTALDRYIETPDKAYSWKLHSKKSDSLATTYIIDMTSQRWRKPDEVDRPIWQHWVTVVRPKNVQSRTAMLFVGGGRNGSPAPAKASDSIQRLALASQTVVCEIGMIPNQPLVFHDDGVKRSEDDLIGYAWDQYLKTADPHWLPRLPMVKAVVRAMDTVQALLASPPEKNLPIENFVIAGGSKRGWTTWMTAAVDRRVTAILPIVIDVLNTKVSMDHHYAAYGFWAPAIGDYVRHKITHRRNTPRYAQLLALVDPYAYRARFTMPKCLVNATGDEFFLPDSSQFYFDDLPGEKHLCYVPNSNHSLRNTDALDTILAFYFSIAHEIPRPRFRWHYEAPGSLSVTAETAPQRVRLWQAHNPDARDFRVQTIGRAYRAREIVARAENQYAVNVAAPAKGWTAFFIQLEFDVGAPTPLRLTTPAYVTPDTLPFSDKRAPEINE